MYQENHFKWSCLSYLNPMFELCWPYSFNKILTNNLIIIKFWNITKFTLYYIRFAINMGSSDGEYFKPKVITHFFCNNQFIGFNFIKSKYSSRLVLHPVHRINYDWEAGMIVTIIILTPLKTR